MCIYILYIYMYIIRFHSIRDIYFVMYKVYILCISFDCFYSCLSLFSIVSLRFWFLCNVRVHESVSTNSS